MLKYGQDGYFDPDTFYDLDAMVKRERNRERLDNIISVVVIVASYAALYIYW